MMQNGCIETREKPTGVLHFLVSMSNFKGQLQN